MPSGDVAMRGGDVAGVVLAAGTSSRMGRNKLLLDLAGETLVHRAVRRASEAGLDPVIVVLGHDAERTRTSLEGLRCRPILNADYEQGIATSLAAGIRAVVAGDASAAVVILADMPHVTTEMIAGLVERYRAGGAILVVSSYGGVHAPPMLYDRALFAELVAADGGNCGKRVVKRHLDEAAIVAWPEEALSDLDVPEDYERAQRRPLALGLRP